MKSIHSELWALTWAHTGHCETRVAMRLTITVLWNPRPGYEFGAAPPLPRCSHVRVITEVTASEGSGAHLVNQWFMPRRLLEMAESINNPSSLSVSAPRGRGPVVTTGQSDDCWGSRDQSEARYYEGNLRAVRTRLSNAAPATQGLCPSKTYLTFKFGIMDSLNICMDPCLWLCQCLHPPPLYSAQASSPGPFINLVSANHDIPWHVLTQYLFCPPALMR